MTAERYVHRAARDQVRVDLVRPLQQHLRPAKESVFVNLRNTVNFKKGPVTALLDLVRPLQQHLRPANG